MCSRTTWSRPRPRSGVFEAKAKAAKFCPQGRGQSSRTPIPGFFLPRDATRRAVMPRRLSVHHSQIQRPTAASCALVYELLRIVFMVLSPLLTILKNSTSYGQISKPKSSQGHASSRPRPRPRPGVFEAKVKAAKFCPRAVLEVEASPRRPHPWFLEIYSRCQPTRRWTDDIHDPGLWCGISVG